MGLINGTLSELHDDREANPMPDQTMKPCREAFRAKHNINDDEWKLRSVTAALSHFEDGWQAAKADQSDTEELLTCIRANAEVGQINVELNMQVAELREALEYYADPENWKLRIGFDKDGNPNEVMPNVYFRDKGKVAREALAKHVNGNLKAEAT